MTGDSILWAESKKPAEDQSCHVHMPLEESHERNLVCRWYQWNTEFGKSRHLFFFFLILAVLGKRICTSIVNKRISTEFVQSTFYKHGNVVLKKKKNQTNRQGYFQQKLHSCCLNTSELFFSEGSFDRVLQEQMSLSPVDLWWWKKKALQRQPAQER